MVAKDLCVTIDDLPFIYGQYLADSAGAGRFGDILATLKKYNIKTIGFVVGSQVDSSRAPLLDRFVAEGHIIGNHTFTHLDLNSSSVKSYQDDIRDGEIAIYNWIGETKYFRYPCLHQGQTRGKYDAIAEFLKSGDFVNVPVTIDNDDWLYNKNFSLALNDGDKIAADSIGKNYLEHMQAMTQYYDSIAVAKLGRDINHILLIHMNEINAVYLDSLLSLYLAQGWRFITPEEALADSLYKIKDTYIGEKGTSWLLRF
jgi:peptidoglycan/xylan/chitin deacetylase (PgdA/CDA1 family)